MAEISFVYHSTMRWAHQYQIDWRSPRANDRRRLVHHLFKGWFKDQNLKLSRDYRVDLDCKPSWKDGKWTAIDELEIKITFTNPSTATLLKLTWGGCEISR